MKPTFALLVIIAAALTGCSNNLESTASPGDAAPEAATVGEGGAPDAVADVSAGDSAGPSSDAGADRGAMDGSRDTGPAVPAQSCSQADVQTAIDNASRGTTVTVPSGHCTWTGPLTLTKGITLTGAGAGNTVIVSSGGVQLVTATPDSIAVANSESITISGFTFDGNDSSIVFIEVDGAGESGSVPYRNVLIGDNTFQNGSSATNNGAIRIGGQVRGAIYHNTFDRCNIILRPMGNDSTTEWSNPVYNQFSYGSVDNLYFEDNTIAWSSPYTSMDQAPGWIESGQGGRVVVRFNTWNLANAGGQAEFWDIHGFQNFFGTPNGQTGTMLVEYYDNILTNGAGTVYRWIDHRGSWGMFFDNTYAGSTSPSIEVNQYDGGCTDQIVPTPTNYQPLVNNTYVFNNLVNGAAMSMTAGSANTCGVTENNNWWNESAAFDGTVGIGYGLRSARPATCTLGVGYWATDEGEWNGIHSGADGQLYKCIATNTWSLYYTPYTYPHPLR